MKCPIEPNDRRKAEERNDIMKEQLEAIRAAAKQALSDCADSKLLETLRVQYLGKKGELTGILKQMGKLSAEERPAMGQLANQVRADIENALAEKQNMKNAKAAGIACGTYWYSYATTPAEARQEAELFASVIQGYQFEYPVVLDIEDKVQTALTKEQVSAVINAFCEVMESKGYYVSLYSYASFLNTYVYQSVLEDYDIWVAHFNVSRPSYSKTSYGMWQYSNSGNINGINGNVDLDYSYKCYPDLMTKYHLNGF